MHNIIDRDPVAMEQFCQKLADFCDTMEHKSCVLRKKCEEADYAMQDENGKLVVNRLNSMADDILVQVAQARALVSRISRSAALLAESEEEA